MKIFLDVGGHNGETLNVALDPKWGFETVHSFEPSTYLFSKLSKIRDRRLIVHKFGLGKHSEFRRLFGAGTVGGSIYKEKRFADKNSLSFVETVEIQEATTWLINNTKFNDLIFLKMNCEGAEADILENLIKTGFISKIKAIYVDFDVRKIPGQEHRQYLLEEQMTLLNIDYTTPDKLGTKGEAAIEKWLQQSLPIININFFRKWFFKLKLYLPLSLLLKTIILKYFPKNLSIFLIKKFGQFYSNQET